MGSAPVGVQCPLTSSLGEFPGYWDWLCWAFAPVGVQRLSIRLPHLSVFHSLFFACHWISLVYFSRRRYLHLATNPPPVPRLGTGTRPQWTPRRSFIYIHTHIMHT